VGNIWEFLLQTLTVSLTAAVLLIVKYLLADKLSPRWQYGIWGLLALRALIPAGMTRQVLLPLPAWVDMCKTAAERGLASAYAGPWDAMDAKSVLPWPSGAPESVTDWLFVAYALGAAAYLLWKLAAYARLRLALRRGAPASEAVSAQIAGVCEKYGLRASRAVEVEGLPTAFACGVFRPVLAVPKGGVDDKVLLHELLHLKYFDAAQGIFWCLIRALHWCNPFMHYVLDRVGNDLESLCDQRVLERLEGEERREYGGILLGMANEKYARAPGTSSISNGGRNISRRIAAIVRFKLYPRGMALASVCIAVVLATPLLLGTASADTGHMHPGPQRELDRSFAVARTTRCRTPAAALDTYAKGLLYDNGVFLTAASPFEKHEELYEGMRASGADGWVAYHYEAVPEQYSIETGSGYLINNLVSTENGCEAELVLTVSYVADLENGGWLKDADGDTLTGLYVIPVRAYEAEGWVVEETGERQFIAADAIVYDSVSLARWGNDVLPWRDTVSVERETGTVTLRRNIYAMASDSSVGLAGVPQGYSDSVYRPDAVFRTMAELFCVEYTCNEANFPRSVAKLEMLPLGSVDEAYAIDGTEYESSGWRNDSWDGKVYTMSEEFRYDAPLLPEPEFKAAAVRISLDGEVVDEFVMEGGAENGGA
jgi:beta-lactamase regulating signal transducer with metallopeptidase domain